MLPQPVLLLAHLKPVCAHLGRIWAKRNPKRNEKASEYQWLLTICPVSTKARNIQISCLNSILGHGAIWPHLGAILVTSWLILEPILAQPVLLLVHLKPVFARLGRILAHLGTETPQSWKTNGFKFSFQSVKQNTKIECLGAISGHLDPTWCHLGAILAQSWPRLEPILAQPLLAHLKLVSVHLGRILAHLGTEIPNNLKKASENQPFGICLGRF